MEILKPIAILAELKNKSSLINRNCRIRASNDAEAMECFLNEYSHKETTFRSYKKEAERFLVWCLRERKTSLAKLDRDDVEAYIEFMKDPQPAHVWCGPKGGRKNVQGVKEWFPFNGPLSKEGIKTALTILNSMMSYLTHARYVDFNPFALIRRKDRFKDQFLSRKVKIEERILDEREWRALLITLDEEPEDGLDALRKKQRLRFLIAILFFLGLRIEEVSRAVWGNFAKINGKWWFFVKGKGDRLGKIPVNSSMLNAMMTYRHAQGMLALPRTDEQEPLITSFFNKKSLSTRQLSNLIKNLAEKAAKKFELEPKVKYKLEKMSAHWLRHLSASRQDLAGISFTNIKSNLRHQNEQTTRQYVHAFDDERHEQMEKLTF